MTEAELLFSEVLNCSRLDLYQNKNSPLNNAESLFLSVALKRRVLGEPIQYILGKTEFMGLNFKVTPDVLIPRPETEILVENTIKIAESLSRSVSNPLRILDIGTGSGCIAISLAKFIKNVKVYATDISEKALQIAKQNALLNNVKVDFLQSNLFQNYRLSAIGYGLIVSNPPYVPACEINTLQPEVRCEPCLALDGGVTGLKFYSRIIPQAGHYLKAGGFLIMEIGFGQKEKIENILQKYKNFEIIEIVKDYNRIDRVIAAKLIR